MDKITGNPDQRINLALARYQIKTGREILQTGTDNLSVARAELTICYKIDGNTAEAVQELMIEARAKILHACKLLDQVQTILDRTQNG
jgi:hypothetical protein